MPALSGGVVQTLYNGNGTPLIVISEWYVEGTGALRDVATSTSTGTKTGAFVVDNLTGATINVNATSPETGKVRSFSVPPSGRVLTVAQLAAIPAPDGPITTIQDLAGMSPQLVSH